MKRPPTNPTQKHTLSYQLREMIEARGVTAYTLGRQAGVDPGVISRFLTGQRYQVGHRRSTGTSSQFAIGGSGPPATRPDPTHHTAGRRTRARGHDGHRPRRPAGRENGLDLLGVRRCSRTRCGKNQPIHRPARRAWSGGLAGDAREVVSDMRDARHPVQSGGRRPAGRISNLPPVWPAGKVCAAQNAPVIDADPSV